MNFKFLQTDMLEIMLQGVYVLNKNWQFVYINKAAEDALKVKRGDILGANIWEKFPMMINSVFHKYYIKTMRNRTSMSFEVKGVYTQTWKKVYVYPNDDGICVFFNDITGKKVIKTSLRISMEEALRDSDEKLRYAFDLAAVGMAIIGVTGTFIKANQSFCKFIGYSEQELLSLRCRDITHMDDVEFLIKEETRLFIGEIDSFQLEKRFVHKSGEVLWGRVRASLVRNTLKEPQYIVVEVQDITRQKNAELAWYYSEEKFKLMFNNAVDIMVLIRFKNGEFEKILEVNHISCRRFGGTKQELKNSTLFELTAPEDRHKLLKIASKLQAEKFFRGELRGFSKRGEVIPLELISRVFKLNDEQVVLAVARDITERKKIENELKRNEEQFRSVVQTASEAIICIDSTETIVFWNQAAEVTFGFSKNEAVGNSIKIIFLRESIDKYSNLLAKASDRVVKKPVELICVRKNRFEFAAELSLSKWQTDESGFYTLIVRDITERKLAEETLRVSEEKFRSAFDYAAVGMVMTSMQGDFIKVNKAFARMTGYTEKELIMKCYKDITLLQDNQEALVNHISRLKHGETNMCNFQSRLVHKLGHMIWVSANISVIHDGNNKPQFLIQQIQDITEKRITELALRESEEKFRMIVDNANDGITLIMVDEKNRLDSILEANKTAEQYYGKIKGKPSYELRRKIKSKNRTDEEILDRIFNNEKVVWEEDAVSKDGTIVPLELSGKLVRINNERVILTVARDISERKLAENALIEINNKLRTVNEELVKTSRYKSDFLNTMTHELKTPLTAILILTGELLSESTGDLSEEQEEYLKDIQESAKQLLDMINDLLALAKIESGKLGLNFTRMKVGSVAFQVVKNLIPLKNKKEIKINLKITDEHIIVADPKQIGQILTNLLSNAIKFTKPKSSIELIVHDVSEPDKGVIVKVKDSGPGIPKEEQQRIFDSFYQVSSGLTKNYPGSGLGLALVKKIVNLYNGWVKVDSSPGTGAFFTVFLPVNPQFTDELD